MENYSIKPLKLYKINFFSLYLIFFNYLFFHILIHYGYASLYDLLIGKKAPEWSFRYLTDDINAFVFINLLSYIFIPFFDLFNKYLPCKLYTYKPVFYFLSFLFICLYFFDFIFLNYVSKFQNLFEIIIIYPLLFFPFFIYSLYKIKYYDYYFPKKKLFIIKKYNNFIYSYFIFYITYCFYNGYSNTFFCIFLDF